MRSASVGPPDFADLAILDRARKLEAGLVVLSGCQRLHLVDVFPDADRI